MLAAVIGAGAAGLAATKNFLEEGIDVVCFERSETIGGIWQWKDDEDLTTVLESTQTNWSKHKMCYTDFPHLESVQIHPLWTDMRDYFNRFADVHNLRPKIKLSTKVKLVHLLEKEKEDEGDRYEVTFEEEGVEGEQKVVVDRVALCTGLQGKAYMPSVPDLDKFEGYIRHSQAFKSAKPYAGKNVLVVGSRSSAVDIISALVKQDAGQVYMSHRGGVCVLPRMWRGKPFDFLLTRRAVYAADWLDRIKTYSSGGLLNPVAKVVMKSSFKVRPEWNFWPLPDIRAGIPTISDELISLLESGRLISVAGIERILGPSEILLSDGTTLSSIDAIVFATGYDQQAPVLLSPSTLEKLNPPKEWDTARDEKEVILYQYLLPPALPSLAVLYQSFASEGALIQFDVKTMWLARVWSGAIPLPPVEARWKEAKREMEWFNGLKKYCKPSPGAFPFVPQMHFYAREIGCQLEEHLSYGSIMAWWWSFKNPRLCHMLLDGVDCPQVYRLWGTKAWGPAEDTIRQANGLKPKNKR